MSLHSISVFIRTHVYALKNVIPTIYKVSVKYEFPCFTQKFVSNQVLVFDVSRLCKIAVLHKIRVI